MCNSFLLTNVLFKCGTLCSHGICDSFNTAVNNKKDYKIQTSTVYFCNEI